MLCKSDKPFIIIITGKTNNYCQKLGGETIIRLLKKVVWTFPERNGKIIGWLVGIPAVTVNLSEWGVLAELALVMVPGSVEAERMFSTMTFIKDNPAEPADHPPQPVRTYLQPEHLHPN